MRIVAGKFKARPIQTPKGNNTRPTTDRVRESVFNILAHHPEVPEIENARVIDLFAGSGALGLEALSRGASFCLFVEIAAGARGIIRENIEALGLFGVTRIHRRSATELGPKPTGVGEKFNLVFLDPPYGQGLVVPALNQLSRGDWLEEGALAVVESDEEEVIVADGWSELESRDYGGTRITILKSES
ncbi:MAG: 16S rRNA (guanine(966)-N(2))-methyltransferase RsmD [Ponticaulis sp.]|nr:16S rRNA (guanine(966)-N(2))-methyltransferase RsmD [Ponticaulis sp.]